MARILLPSPLLLILAIIIDLACCFNSPSISKACQPSGFIGHKDGHCQCSATENNCCEPGKSYPQYLCSPPVTSSTPATMTLNIFPGSYDYRSIGCDDRFHMDSELAVALSTGWYSGGSRCLKNIKISANGRTVAATVVDYCDSVYGCNADRDYRQPCANNVVDASPAVWEALGIPKSQLGQINVTWADE